MPIKNKKLLLVAVALVLVVDFGLLGFWWVNRSRRLAPDLRGTWNGTIQNQTVKLRIVLRVDKAADGRYSGVIDSPDQGAKDIPIQSFTLENGTVLLQLAALGATYQGQVSRDGTEISGSWRQATLTFPLTFKRTTETSTVTASLPPGAYARDRQAPLQGWWKGTLNTPAGELRLLFKIAHTSPGKYQGTVDSVDQGARAIPLTTVEYTEPNARIDVQSVGGTFEGALKEEGTQLQGNWNQAGKSFFVELERVEPRDEAPTPASAYAFKDDAELQGIWFGTLDVNGTRLRLVFKIAKAANNSYSATMDSLDQGGKDIPASSVTFTDSEALLLWNPLRAQFLGHIDQGKLTGHWKQGQAEFPLELTRTNQTAQAGVADR